MNRENFSLSVNKRNTGSQESKVTSTPQNASPNYSLSPSISTIKNLEEGPMEIDSEIENEASKAQSSDEDVETTLNQSSFETSMRRSKKTTEIKWVPFWTSLKPKDKNSLYYKIIMQPDQLESIAVDLFNTYSRDGKVAVNLILQLFVDLCGYKKLEIAKIYSFENINACQVVKDIGSVHMEPQLKKKYKFIFMKCSAFESAIDYTIGKFFQYFVIQGFTTEALFDDVLVGHIFEFLNCMSFSPWRHIRVTGFVLVIKFLTAFVQLHSKYFQESSNTIQIISSSDEKKTTIGTFIDFLYLIYDKNCLIPDKKSYLMKIKSTQEMLKWIQLFPDLFIFRRRCLGRLIKLMTDRNAIVRQSALATCEKLVTTVSIENQIQQRIELCLKIVSGRFVDLNHKVATKAVNIFTAALERFSTYITNEYKVLIMYRIFEKNLLVARAAGNFLATYLHLQDKTDEQLLLSLTKIAFLRAESGARLPFFLESCFKFIPELTAWNTVINILLNNNIAMVTRKHLIEVFYESVRFSLTGKFSQNREVAHKDNSTNRDVHSSAANALIPNFKNLIIAFQSDKMCMNKLIEMLAYFNYDLCDLTLLYNDFSQILSLLKDLFNASTDRMFLENITNVFDCMFDKRFFNQANIVIDSVKMNYVGLVRSNLEQLSPLSADRVLLTRLRHASMKISVLYSKFNLMNILKWKDIFKVWDNRNFKVLKYMIVCCKWHLVWSLRMFLLTNTSNGSNGSSHNGILYNNCKDFIYCCLEMLKGANDNSEFFMVFENLCDLYIIFDGELKRKRQFSHFIIPINEPVHIKAIFDFVIRYVIRNANLHVKQRQTYLAKIVNVLYLGVLPVECFTNILRFYHSHYAEFGKIMDDILRNLYLCHPSLPLLVINTLIEVYKEILEQNQVVDVSSRDGKQLKFLTKKFAKVKEMKHVNGLLKLVNISIYFASKNKQNYNFLYYASYFASMLNEEGKSEAYDLLKKLEMATKDSRNKMLFLFVGALKPLK